MKAPEVQRVVGVTQNKKGWILITLQRVGKGIRNSIKVGLYGTIIYKGWALAHSYDGWVKAQYGVHWKTNYYQGRELVP